MQYYLSCFIQYRGYRVDVNVQIVMSDKLFEDCCVDGYCCRDGFF